MTTETQTQAPNDTPDEVDNSQTTEQVVDAGIKFSNEPTPTPEKQPDNDLVIYEYNPTGDAALDLALSFVGNLGIGADHPTIVAASKGDFSSLETHLAALGDRAKGYKAYLQAAKDSFQRQTSAAKAKEAAVIEEVHQTVGGKDTWNSIAAFVSEHATDAERAEIDAAFTKGGIAAKSMATYLLNTYNNSKGKTPAKVVKAEASGAKPNSTALSPRQYSEELRRLARESRGVSVESHQEYAGLRQRALAYRS